MSFTNIRVIPGPDELKEKIPVDGQLQKKRGEQIESIKKVLSGSDNRFLVICGPCSAHDEKAVIEYTVRLSKIHEKVKEKLIIIPRIYTNKPRTTGEGYKGMMHQPDYSKKPNLTEGIIAIRKMHIRSFSESGIVAADEMLYPGNHPYLDDILGYVAVGARSSENQHHRLTASGLDIPVGMKNPTSGDLRIMLNSIKAAQIPHIFTYNGWEVQTSGNTYAHAILRGAKDNSSGKTIPNYNIDKLDEVFDLYSKQDLANRAVIVDVNHDNSGKKYQMQPEISLEVMKNRKKSTALNNMVKGLMIESYLIGGSQSPDGKVYGQSITDPCIGWEDTEDLLMKIADTID